MNGVRVHVIDDDADVRDSLAFLLSTADVPATTYESAAAFLAVAAQARGCIVTDLRMPQMGGLELISRLKSMGVALPIIVITGHGDVSLAVEAMKAGVADFIEKPFDDAALLNVIEQALEKHANGDEREALRSDLVRRIDLLSARERQVLDGLIAGKANKMIANELDISPRTIEIYRAHVMTKMQARSLSELVRMALLAGVA
jgi:two-component system response regulator FixJ